MSDKEFSQQKCGPCNRETPLIDWEDAKKLMSEVPDWILDGYVVGQPKVLPTLKRKYKFRDFSRAMKFVNKVADLAEHHGHHPDIHVYYNVVELKLHTHAIRGLSENDFIMAASIDAHVTPE